MTIDVLPTVAGMIGAALPERPIDGRDIGPLLRTGKDESLEARPLAFYYNANDLEAVRKGRWKLILPHGYNSLDTQGKDGMPGKYKWVRSKTELYDLSADRSETKDLSAERPEVVAELQKDVEAFRAELGDNLTKREGTARRPAGTVPEAGGK
jgi:arylsulfatase A-like enzyme